MIQKQILKRDLSRKAMRNEVYKASAQAPVTLYSATTFALSSFYLLLVGLNPIALAGAVAGGTVAFGNWVWQAFINRDSRAAKIIEKYRQQLEAERSAAIDNLNRELQDLGDEEGKQQIRLLNEKFSTFTRILAKKFQPEELTYARYLSIAEQVYLGALANLEKVSLTLQSIEAIDLKHIQAQIKQQKKQNNSDTLQALEQRLALWNQQQEKALSLKNQNQVAMTQLDAVSARLADLDTSSKSNTLELDDALSELKRLIERAEQYSN